MPTVKRGSRTCATFRINKLFRRYDMLVTVIATRHYEFSRGNGLYALSDAPLRARAAKSRSVADSKGGCPAALLKLPGGRRRFRTYATICRRFPDPELRVHVERRHCIVVMSLRSRFHGREAPVGRCPAPRRRPSVAPSVPQGQLTSTLQRRRARVPAQESARHRWTVARRSLQGSERPEPSRIVSVSSALSGPQAAAVLEHGPRVQRRGSERSCNSRRAAYDSRGDVKARVRIAFRTLAVAAWTADHLQRRCAACGSDRAGARAAVARRSG